MGRLISSFNPARWWRARRHDPSRIDPETWERIWAGLPLLAGLDATESDRLRALALRFLDDKALEQPQDLGLRQVDRLSIALQACLPILNLGLEWYRDWYALILYPDEFIPEREWVDENGLVWLSREAMSGEAWEQGPVILSWADVQASGARDGFNVIIHEMAHKLDMRNGAPNGHPPLHARMSDARWARDLGEAFAQLRAILRSGAKTPLDPYAAESPGEFFAVCSETFFELPQLLQDIYPAVYAQLRDFYRQDPSRRLNPL